MSDDQLMDILRAGLWTAFMISLPILFVSVVFWLSLGFVGQTLVSFYNSEIIAAIERR